MTLRFRSARAAVALVLAVSASHPVRVLQAQGAASRPNTLPAKLGDAEFWKLETDISEPNAYFQIEDNFTSNEAEVARLVTQLRTDHHTGGVYIGVGPEQNFSYIAAVRPQMAFIIDIRRQAIMQHLLFKAVFELAKDRADFISLLFSKPRPAGLDSTTSIQKIWDAFWPIPTDLAQGPKNYIRIYDHLTKTHGFTFTDDEQQKLKWVWDNFYNYGPTITTSPNPQGRGGGNALSFADLTGYQVDYQNQIQSFMATEADYRFVKSLHEKNLIVPVSGDFAGVKALRGIGSYLTDHGGTVSAYYVSNVEQYVFRDGHETAFYDNAATLPVNASSVFIRAYALRNAYQAPYALCPIAEYLKAVAAGRVGNNYNLSLSCAH